MMASQKPNSVKIKMDILTTIGPINTGLIFGILLLGFLIIFATILKKFFTFSGLKILAVFLILTLTTFVIIVITLTSLSANKLWGMMPSGY